MVLFSWARYKKNYSQYELRKLLLSFEIFESVLNTDSTRSNSLSRREESWKKNCLLGCLSAGSKEHFLLET